MNWDAIGAMGEIVGATAVVLTLAYLAIQIRLTRELEQATSIRDMLDKAIDIMVHSSRNPGSFEILRKGIVDYSALPIDEKDRFHEWATLAVVSTEQAMYMHQSKLLPQESWTVWEGFTTAIITSTGGAQWWGDYKKVFNKEVVGRLEAAASEKEIHHLSIYDVLPHWRE